MTETKWPRLLRDAVGMRVRTTRVVGNHYGACAIGTTGLIDRAYRWTDMTFRADGCLHCGVRLNIAGCSRNDFEPILEN